MKKIVCGIFITLLIVSCAETPQNQNKNTEIANEAPPLTPAEKADQYGRKEAGKGTFNNTENALLYMLSTGNINFWGSLVSASSYVKEVTGGDYVVLCPTNEVLKSLDFELVTALKMPENKDVLDALIANHMTKGPFEILKFTSLTEISMLSGKTLTIDPGQSRIGGALYTREQVNTAKGAVLVMNEVIDFPEAELSKRMKKGVSKRR